MELRQLLCKSLDFYTTMWYNIDKENGLVERLGFTCGGDVPRHFFLLFVNSWGRKNSDEKIKN